MVAEDQKREALSRLLQSQTFARADQLRRFLRYVCEEEIAGHGSAITEHAIAVQALGRQADYVPGDDSSVRNRAHALRQKLEEYYRLEEPGCAIRVELRKGSYVPVFAESVAPAAVELPAAIAPLAPPPPPTRRALLPFALGLGSAAALGGLGTWWARSRSGVDPILAEAWAGMLDPGAKVVICLASPPTLLLKSFREGALPEKPKLTEAPPAIADWYAGLQMMDGGGRLYMGTTMNAALVGDSLAVTRAVRLLASHGIAPQVLPEWGTRPLALRDRNLLLVGSPNYSPYAARILQKMPLTVWYNPETREEVIAEDLEGGRKPKRVFRPNRDAHGQYTHVYGLLTVAPSSTHGEGSETTVLFSGVTSAGPQGAMEFFCSPASLRDLRTRLQRAGHATLPRCYQVVLRCGVDRNLALTWSYEHHRVLDKAPVLD